MLDIVPVFARTLPAAGVPFILDASDPSTPAMGSPVMNGDTPDGSYARRRIVNSASDAMVSRLDNPEPSTSCWLSRGMPHDSTRMRNPSRAASLVGKAPGAVLRRSNASAYKLMLSL